MAGFDVRYPSGNMGNRNVADIEPGKGVMSLSSDPTGALSKEKKEQAEDRLRATLAQWWQEARDAHAANRAQQHIDADFYDHHQIDQATASAMIARGQAPLVYNLAKTAIDWIIGTERRTRIDWKIHPRGKEDLKAAQAKQAALKYVDDVNDGSFARSAAFSDACRVGVGWIEECVNHAGDEEPITIAHEDWKVMWWDPFARKLDLSDARYIHRAKWLDVDYGITMFPDQADIIERHARATDEIDLDDCEDPADVPGFFFGRTTNTYDIGASPTQLSGGRLRSRVRIIETWYTKPVKVKRLTSILPDMNRKVYNPAEHDAYIAAGLASLYDGIVNKKWVALWVPGTILSNQESPYKHNRYPFTPCFAYRDDKTKMPYGPMRGMRDAQDDYNKRRAKALFLLSVNRVIYENGAIEEEDEDDFKQEAAAPDAQLRVANGALRDNRIKFETGTELAQSQLGLMEQDRIHIFENNGITRENLGQDSGAISGRAILAKQQQGAVTTAEIFDNYRLFQRVSGQKSLSNVEQFMTMPKRIRIVGAKGAMDWMMLNEPMYDPATGQVIFENDLAASEADFHVDQQDYRETTRMAMAETLFETMKGLADPNLQLMLLDLAVELTDIPNRDEIVRRIRAMSGQVGPGEEEDPAVLEQKAMERQMAEQERAANTESLRAKTRKDNAIALKTETDAVKSNVEGKAVALNTAQLLAGAVQLAPAADRLAEFPQPEPAPPQAGATA